MEYIYIIPGSVACCYKISMKSVWNVQIDLHILRGVSLKVPMIPDIYSLRDAK